MNNQETLSIPYSVFKTSSRFKQWFATTYRELFNKDIHMRECDNFNTWETNEITELLDRLICEELPMTHRLIQIWKKENKGKPSLIIKSRNRELADGRKLMSLFLRNLGYSYTAIGAIMDKDHSTIIHSVNTANDLLKTDANFRRIYYNVKHALEYENSFRPFNIQGDNTKSTLLTALLQEQN
jgi:hypothetical protein